MPLNTADSKTPNPCAPAWPGRFGLADYLWRPRRVFNSVQDWAVARGRQSMLRPLPVGEAGDGQKTSDDWRVANLPHGKVIGDLRLIATAENDVLGGLQALHGIDDPAAHWSVHQWRLRRPHRLRGTAAVLAAASGANYYHWLFDSLPRLHLLQQAGVDWAKVDCFLLNGSPRSFDVESLALLGIPVERTRRCSKRQITSAEHLLVPPMPAARQGGIAPWMCDFLRASFLAPVRPQLSDSRLYLSRRNSPKRRLANETQVENFFRERGFVVLELETLSFREQVAVFAGAAFVAGPHGAGWANLVFAPPATRVLELFHPHHQAQNYRRIAGIVGMNYVDVVGDSTGETEANMSEKLGPYTIPLARLEQAWTNLETR